MKNQVKYMVIGFSLLMVNSFFSGIVEGLFFPDDLYMHRAQINQRLEDRLWRLIIPLIIAPIFEEWLFRGIILSKLNRKLSFGLSNVICALLFSFAHLDFFLLPYFLNGVVYGWVKIKAKNLYTVMLLHNLYNGIVILVLIYL